MVWGAPSGRTEKITEGAAPRWDDLAVPEGPAGHANELRPSGDNVARALSRSFVMCSTGREPANPTPSQDTDYMIKRTVALFSLAVLASTGSASVAQAQVSNPLKFTVFAGGALPTGDFKDGANTGYTVGAGLDYRVPLSPFGVRAEGIYSSFGGKDDLGLEDVDFSDLGLNANAVVWLPNAGSPMRAYLTGGPSYSRLKVNMSDSGLDLSVSENKWGFNVGGGLDFALGSLSTRLDVRYRRFSATDDESGESSAFQYIPITFGITF
jgi:opacity protein-like surface antigen